MLNRRVQITSSVPIELEGYAGEVGRITHIQASPSGCELRYEFTPENPELPPTNLFDGEFYEVRDWWRFAEKVGLLIALLASVYIFIQVFRTADASLQNKMLVAVWTVIVTFAGFLIGRWTKDE